MIVTQPAFGSWKDKGERTKKFTGTIIPRQSYTKGNISLERTFGKSTHTDP